MRCPTLSSRPRRRGLSGVLAVALGTALVLNVQGTASAAAARYVGDPASLVDPIIGTSGAVNDFPGAAVPFGMVQWSPDTPSRPPGGGYEYNDGATTGFSLTHISGPGCAAFGDVPILPTTGAIGTHPGDAKAPFTHADEHAAAGYYDVTAGGVQTELTATKRTGMARFTFPQTQDANLLFKLSASAAGVDATRVRIIGDHEISGSVTSGHFCGADDRYTVHFDMTFDRPFVAYGTWKNQEVQRQDRTMRHQPEASAKRALPAPRPAPTGRAAPHYHGPAPDGRAPQQPRIASPQSGADGAYLTFSAIRDHTVQAKVGISFTSDAGAKKNRIKENPGWHFDRVRTQAHAAWRRILDHIRIGGGSGRTQQMFYTALYHALLHPNVFSDVDRRYMGFDNQVHRAAKGHREYANFSGWDIYRTQVQLAALVAPHQTSDAIRSMLNQYDQTGQLPKWALANGESYVMVGDPAASILASAYAFGARDFNHGKALTALVTEGNEPNNVRPGLRYHKHLGYLPTDGSYGCCNFYGPVSTELEYDTADHAVAAYAKALGKSDTARMFARRAQNWQNVFNPGSGYVQPKDLAGRFQPGFSGGASDGMVEGTAAQYTPMVPFDIEGASRAGGGHHAWIDRLDGLLANIADPGPENADLSNEPSFEIPWEYDYVGAPYKTQDAVRRVQQTIYTDGPAGMAGNDDLGTMSAWYVWSALGIYPETPGTANLALGSPLFARAKVHLPTGNTLTIDAPNAGPDHPYVQRMTVRGKTWTHAYLKPNVVRNGGRITVTLGGEPNKAWASGADDAPPSDTRGLLPALGYPAASSQVIVAPGGTATTRLGVRSLSTTEQHVQWHATADQGIAIGPKKGTIIVPAGASQTQAISVGAPDEPGRYLATFHLTSATGTELPKVAIEVDVAAPGALWPYYNNIGTAQDGKAGAANYDGVGWAYSAQALTKEGITPGATVTADGLTYTWPDVASGAPDNIVTAGQRIPVNAPEGATKIGIVGSATNANPGAQGDIVVAYADGTQQTVQVGISDWTLGAGAFPPAYGNTTVATMPYRDTTSGGRQDITTYVFAASAGLQAEKTVASIMLPSQVGDGQLHVFAFAFGSATAP